jgi:GrpB-like predicted nucleotidyltransferase (UPF0157 family)/GNAT superfamily N-acetyltransferase
MDSAEGKKREKGELVPPSDGNESRTFTGGLMKIEVVPYNSNWPKMFESEKKIISNALGDNCVAIHHVGSTSVPGLAAKPKIDIIAVAKDRKSAIENLEKAGYKHKGEWNIPLKCGFTKRDGVAGLLTEPTIATAHRTAAYLDVREDSSTGVTTKRPEGLVPHRGRLCEKSDVNLHLFFEENHPEIELNLRFRDFLRTHPDICREYGALKMQILQDDAAHEKIGKLSFPVYTIRKRKFIDDVIEKIGFNRLRILKCITDDEWSAAKLFRQKYFFDRRGISDPYQWTFDNKNHEHFLLYQGTKIIGYSHIQLLPESKAALRIIVLLEKSRRQNFGSHFLETIEKWLKVHGYKSLHVESSKEAMNFYKKHKYIEMPFDDPDGYESDSQDIAVGKILG